MEFGEEDNILVIIRNDHYVELLFLEGLHSNRGPYMILCYQGLQFRMYDVVTSKEFDTTVYFIPMVLTAKVLSANDEKKNPV